MDENKMKLLYQYNTHELLLFGNFNRFGGEQVLFGRNDCKIVKIEQS